MLLRKLIMAAALACTTAVALPAVAEAKPHHGWHKKHRKHHHHDDRRYYHRDRYADRHYYRDYRPRNCKSGGTTGTLLGAVGGALLGREIDTYGDRLPGTIIGAGAGALLGRELTQKNRC
jgi:uncharacterized protein YcfJ